MRNFNWRPHETKVYGTRQPEGRKGFHGENYVYLVRIGIDSSGKLYSVGTNEEIIQNYIWDQDMHYTTLEKAEKDLKHLIEKFDLILVRER